MNDLYSLSLSEAADAVRDRSVSPVDLTRACLDRIVAVEPAITAFIEVDANGALAAAEQLEGEAARGELRGPLHGVPVAAKDIFDVAGLPTTAASRILAGSGPAEHDCEVVARLRVAGAVVLGKLNLHEFAYGATGVDSHVGPARNPWDPRHVTGGSSSGSGAAVAAGECFGALGTDTGGSIRIPSSLCGVAGIKPTFGRVSRRGVFPLSWALDHVGPMARTVKDVALMLQVIAGADPHDPSTAEMPVPDYAGALEQGISGLRIGVPDSFFFDNLDPEVDAAVRSAVIILEGLGAKVQPVTLPYIAEIPAALTAIMLPEALAVHRHWMQERPADYSENVRYRLELGSMFNAVHYIEAQRFREMVTRAWREDLFQGVDLIVVPGTPTPAPLIEESDLSATMGLIRLTNPLNLMGIPAASVPCGFSSGGLPLGLQLAGPWWEESTVLRAGHAYEQACSWKDRHPPI
jgi:aspartyl-tRNA(Asn)/glutamyl-tRNA(Gln) amidotransferase subunit A